MDESLYNMGYLNLDLYKGLWISIVGGKVVTSGKECKKVYEWTKERYPDNVPFMMKVPHSMEMLVFASSAL